MLSTTNSDRQRGQVLVLFAGGAIVLMIIMALVYDGGMMLAERRDQQNAADAAALAGARFVLDSSGDALRRIKRLQDLHAARRKGGTDGGGVEETAGARQEA